MHELCEKGAEELAGLIASGKVKSAQVVDAYIARIEEVNAVTVTLADEARAAAAAVDRAVAAGKPLGSFAGVPFTIKKNIDVADSATTWGVRAMAEQIASADAPIVARLREAGAIPLGLGNDLGGSLRVPSQMCGTAALRPSRGRVANSAVTQPWPEPIALQMTNCQRPMAPVA